MRITKAAGAAVALACVALTAPASAATPLFNESFERGAVGTAVTAATTAYDQSIGDRGDGDGTIKVVIDKYGVKGHAGRFYNTSIATTAFGFLGERVGSQQLVYLRRYYYLDARPSYRTSVLLYKFGGSGNGQLGGTHNGSFAFGGTGQANHFVLVNNNTNTTQSAAVVPTGAWFRVEVCLDFRSGTGVQTARLFLGSNWQGRTPSETITGPLTGTSTDYLEDGILTNPNRLINVKLDGSVNGSTWPGPAAI